MAVRLLDGAVDLSLDVGAILLVDAADLDEQALAEVEEVQYALEDALRELLIRWWPVDTGRSLMGWAIQWEGLVWVIRNPVPYAEYVHRAGESREVWRDLEQASERLLARALPRFRGIVAAQRAREAAGGRRSRSLFGFDAPGRSLGERLFRATREAYRRVSPRERTRRQIQRRSDR